MFKSNYIKNRLRNAVLYMFRKSNDPLANTLRYRKDPGLFGPESMTWRIISDVSGFMGGVRALLIQAAHPEVVAGVYDHSLYKEDPFGRLSRTGDYVAVTCFGAMPEVNRIIQIVHKMHERVQGVSVRGKAYNANSPDLSAWVHNCLVN